MFSGCTFKTAQVTGVQSSLEFHEGEGASPGLVHLKKRGSRAEGVVSEVTLIQTTAIQISLAQAQQGNPGHLECWICLCAAFTFPPRPREKRRLWDTTLLQHWGQDRAFQSLSSSHSGCSWQLVSHVTPAPVQLCSVHSTSLTSRGEGPLAILSDNF